MTNIYICATSLCLYHSTNTGGCVFTLSNIQIFPDKARRREILHLDVYCTYAARGCDWRGKLKELDVHK